MSYLVLEIDTADIESRVEQTMQLDGVEYLLTVFWSEAESCLYLDIEDQDGNPICLLVRLVVSFPLLRKFQADPRVPPGVLSCIDMSAVDALSAKEITAASELGGRVLLTYVSSDDADLQAGGVLA